MLAPSITMPDDSDGLFDEAVKVIVEYDNASASVLQRKLSIGYVRAARLLDQLETAKIVGPAEGSKPRKVLIHSYKDYVAKMGDYKHKETESTSDIPGNEGDLLAAHAQIPTNWVDLVAHWIKVLKVSALIFIPYWLFGFEGGLFVAIVVICLFLSKVSLTIEDIAESLKENSKAKPSK